jgi:hypothetical protein
MDSIILTLIAVALCATAFTCCALIVCPLINCALNVFDYAMEKTRTSVGAGNNSTKDDQLEDKKANLKPKYRIFSWWRSLPFMVKILAVSGMRVEIIEDDHEDKTKLEPKVGTLDKWLANGAHQAQLVQRKPVQQSGTLDQWLGRAPKPPVGPSARV